MQLQAALAFLFLSPPLLASDLYVGPSAPFSEIQPAIDAAAPGDVIHVAPGVYDVFVLTKPLAIVGAGSGQVLVRDPVGVLGCTVSGIPAGTEAVLSGFELGAPLAAFTLKTNPVRLQVSDCAGRVALHDLLSDSGTGSGYSPRIVGLEDAAQVVVSASRLIGTSVGPGGQIPLLAVGSHVWVVDSELRGGDGELLSFSPNPNGIPVGAPGIWVRSSTAEVSRSVIVGGRGGARFTIFPTIYQPEQGGPGVLTFASSTTITGGPGNRIEGGPAAPPAPPESPYWVFGPPPGGPALQIDDTDFGWLTESEVNLASDVLLLGGLDGAGAPEPVVLGDTLIVVNDPFERPTLHTTEKQHALGAASTLHLSGPPSSMQIAAFALASLDATDLPGFAGQLMLPPAAVWPVGVATLDAAGLGSLGVAVPAATALSGVRVWLQGLSLSGTGDAFTAPTLFVIAP
jgi:hypothetical protein